MDIKAQHIPNGLKLVLILDEFTGGIDKMFSNFSHSPHHFPNVNFGLEYFLLNLNQSNPTDGMYIFPA